MNTAIEKFKKFRPRPDYWILFIVLGLSLFGLVMIGSASSLVAYERFSGAHNYYYVGRQAISLVVGIVLMMILATVDYRYWQSKAPWMLGITIALLALAILPGLGGIHKGASRWIELGPFSFQPSEFAKLSLILYLSSWFSNRVNKINIIPLITILAVVALLLVIKQSDLGSLIIIVCVASAMFYISGGSYVQLAITGLLGLLAVAFFIRSSSYRWLRFLTYLNPTSDALNSGYHINQALLAIGSGGILGLGFGRSIQKYLYLPEPYTDSIFAVIAEELGFLRASIILIMFGLIAWRGYKIAKGAPDMFGKLVAVGITTWIVIQAFINIGALTGVLPLTGVPLPFMSYGGSSLMAILMGIGVLLNISKYSNSQ